VSAPDPLAREAAPEAAELRCWGSRYAGLLLLLLVQRVGCQQRASH